MRLIISAHRTEEPAKGASLRGYQVAGLVIAVPGIGLGNCDATKSTGKTLNCLCDHFTRVHSGLRIGPPGVYRNTFAVLRRLTISIDFDRSASFETTTAQSKAPSQESFTNSTARFTSEPFSSHLITSTVLCGGVDKAMRTFLVLKCPSMT